MKKFRKKPVVIEAIRLSETNMQEIVDWTGGGSHPLIATTDSGYFSGMIIRTPEGSMRASTGDWIIKGVKGEFYPCKDDIFRATYDGPLPEDEWLRNDIPPVKIPDDMVIKEKF